MSLGRIGGVYALLHASHQVADHWVQTDEQAQRKGDDGEHGPKACAAHVATLTATQAAFLAAGCIATRERLSVRSTVLGLAINAATHYAADRREHGALPWLIDRVPLLGKRTFYELGDGKAAPCGTGAYALDQSWHIFWLAVASGVIAAA